MTEAIAEPKNAMTLADALPVAVDAMGGDAGPACVVRGALEAVRLDGCRVILVGDQDVIQRVLDEAGAAAWLQSGQLRVQHADEVVEMHEKPASAARKKKASSMRIACDLVKNGEACAALSAGNSGAMMAISLFTLGRIKGVQRPCIATTLTSPGSQVGASRPQQLLVDAGANTDCTPAHLLQFGIMGATFLKVGRGIDDPRVGVVANGTEDTKGTDLTRQACALLAQANVHFRGYVEPNDKKTENVQVLVTDGFTGNLILKTAEATAREVTSQIKKSYARAGLLGKLGGLLSRGVFEKVRAAFDYRETGAAIFLGLNAPAFIAHGSSDDYTIRCGIRTARDIARRNIAPAIAEAIAEATSLLSKKNSENNGISDSSPAGPPAEIRAAAPAGREGAKLGEAIVSG